MAQAVCASFSTKASPNSHIIDHQWPTLSQLLPTTTLLPHILHQSSADFAYAITAVPLSNPLRDSAFAVAVYVPTPVDKSPDELIRIAYLDGHPILCKRGRRSYVVCPLLTRN